MVSRSVERIAVFPVLHVLVLTLLGAQLRATAMAAETAADQSKPGDPLVQEYFERQTEQVARDTLSEIESLEDWRSRRPEYRRQLLEMLGLDPLPPRSPLQAEITGTFPHEDIIVEKLHFQSMPGLYVTGNLYRPKTQDGSLPAVLYGCGHSRVRKEGISYGNKTGYQHHGTWLARNGYVALLIDTIQLGEIEGMHRGTYREGQWWWNNRGFTPAGVEAWNCVRAIDYLQSRPEVDDNRIGMTGRSGGGAYSWWTAAIDERVRVAVPVAGITNMRNHVVDGCIEGHCDCMFMVNTYRWDFPLLAALVAPRPLLISNTDKDRIFPLDGVVDVHRGVRRIYGLYDAGDRLGLHITEGPHKDTQELRVHAFRWLNRFLKDDDSLLTMPAVKQFEPEQLRVFDQLPPDERVTSIAESFVPEAKLDSVPDDPAEFETVKNQWMTSLRSKVFGGWPHETATANPSVETQAEGKQGDHHLRIIRFESQAPYRLPIYLLRHQTTAPEQLLRVIILDQDHWRDVASGLAWAFPDALAETVRTTGIEPQKAAWQTIRESIGSAPVAYVMPRGVGPTEWTEDEKKRIHIRRRFMLLGQTQDGMRVYDVRRALQALEAVDGSDKRDVEGRDDAAFWALYASLFEPEIRQLRLIDLPVVNREAPDLLNVSRFVRMPHVALLAADRVQQLILMGRPTNDPDWEVFRKHTTPPVVSMPSQSRGD